MMSAGAFEQAQDVLDVLAQAVAHIDADPGATGIERARAYSLVAGNAMRAIELQQLADRVAAVEVALWGKS